MTQAGEAALAPREVRTRRCVVACTVTTMQQPGQRVVEQGRGATVRDGREGPPKGVDGLVEQTRPSLVVGDVEGGLRPARQRAWRPIEEGPLMEGPDVERVVGEEGGHEPPAPRHVARSAQERGPQAERAPAPSGSTAQGILRRATWRRDCRRVQPPAPLAPQEPRPEGAVPGALPKASSAPSASSWSRSTTPSR